MPNLNKGNGGAPKATKKEAWDAESWDELETLTTLAIVKAALQHKEDQRIYHKTAYLRRQLIVKRAKEQGLDKLVDAELADV